jgi:hypothetical protein
MVSLTMRGIDAQLDLSIELAIAYDREEALL